MSAPGYSLELPIYYLKIEPHESAAIIAVCNAAADPHAPRDIDAGTEADGYRIRRSNTAAYLSVSRHEPLPRASIFRGIDVCVHRTSVVWQHGVLQQLVRQRAARGRCVTTLLVSRIDDDLFSVTHENHVGGVYDRAALDALLTVRMLALAPGAATPAVALGVDWAPIAAMVDDLRAALAGRPAPSDIDPATGWTVAPGDDEFTCAKPALGPARLVLCGGMPAGIALRGLVLPGKLSVLLRASLLDALAGRWTLYINNRKYVLPVHPFADCGAAGDLRWIVPPAGAVAGGRAVVVRDVLNETD